MEISSYKEENYNIVEVHGDLDASSAVELDNEIKAIFEKNETNIFIDCKDLNYIASAGLGVFMSYIQEIEVKEINFKLFNMSDKILDVFKILGLDTLLSICETKAEVIQTV